MQPWRVIDDDVPPPPPRSPPPNINQVPSYGGHADLIRQQRVRGLVAPGIMSRMYCIDKKSRYSHQPAQASQPSQQVSSRPSSAQTPSGDVPNSILTRSQARQLASLPAARSASPYIAVATSQLQPPVRPEPTAAYLKQASAAPITLGAPRPLLVVLDLNGTLLHRKNRGASFLGRPKLHEFLHYLFATHDVMIWSSARRHNVAAMCQNLLSQAQLQALVAQWSREDLRLSPWAYNEKVQVYKQLSWIWKDKDVQAKNSNPVASWSQENTVLIDDSVDKAASEPYNLIRIEEFEGRQEQMEVDVLGQVVGYLEKLRVQQDVSAYMKKEPFVYDGRAGPVDWEAMSVV